ncbi:MAG TPA: zinc-binding dehydrogenase [Tepidiformaceae bacterium]|nr:zinc-binding dehydrogenase [Tepidiformaceae bacterium]
MRAIRVHPNNGNPVMRFEEVEVRAPGPREVRIRVAAASVNRSDLGRIDRYNPSAEADTPFIPGTDIAGTIEAVGDAVTERKVGDRVAALISGGGYAEQVVTHVASTAAVPDGVDLVVAAVVPVIYLTAWFPLVFAPGLKAGETVLIQSGASGVGTAAIDIAKHLGARVFTTAGSEAKVDRLRERGVDLAINYTIGDFAADVMSATGGRGVDFVLESVGGDVYRKSIDVLAEGGRICSVGNSSGEAEVAADATLVARKGLSVTRFALPSEIPTGGTRRELPKVLDLVAAGTFRPVIDRTFELSEAEAAHRRLEERGNFGKVLLVP